MTIGERLKEWRKENKLSSLEIQDKTGVSQAAISYYENNKREVSITYVIELYKHYDIDIMYILTGDKNNSYLTSEQEQLLQYFNLCDDNTKKQILNFTLFCLSNNQNSAAKEEGKSSTYKIG